MSDSAQLRQRLERCRTQSAPMLAKVGPGSNCGGPCAGFRAELETREGERLAVPGMGQLASWGPSGSSPATPCLHVRDQDRFVELRREMAEEATILKAMRPLAITQIAPQDGMCSEMHRNWLQGHYAQRARHLHPVAGGRAAVVAHLARELS